VKRPFGLFVGTIEPRKNVAVLLEAWRRLLEEPGPCAELVLCGRFGWKADDLKTVIRRAEREGWLRHLGYVEDEQLAALLRDAEVVVLPSLYEGFGLPAVEAQWAGTALIASDIPVLREVTAGAALLVPPDDPQALHRAIRRVLDDPELRRDLVHRGLARVRRLSWITAARRTAAVWFEAAGEMPGTTNSDEGEPPGAARQSSPAGG
jgi:alpha-1,3-rhamnosyl/mannosyltransferase